MQEITVESFPSFSHSKKFLIVDIWICSIVHFYYWMSKLVKLSKSIVFKSKHIVSIVQPVVKKVDANAIIIPASICQVKSS